MREPEWKTTGINHHGVQSQIMAVKTEKLKYPGEAFSSVLFLDQNGRNISCHPVVGIAGSEEPGN